MSINSSEEGHQFAVDKDFFQNGKKKARSKALSKNQINIF